MSCPVTFSASGTRQHLLSAWLARAQLAVEQATVYNCIRWQFACTEQLARACLPSDLRWPFCSTGWQRALNRVPSAVFEPSVVGVRQYSLIDRTACLGVKFLEYSLAGLVAGFVGQGVANSLMLARYILLMHDDFCIFCTEARALPTSSCLPGPMPTAPGSSIFSRNRRACLL